jgi:hypothetical protein
MIAGISVRDPTPVVGYGAGDLLFGIIKKA